MLKFDAYLANGLAATVRAEVDAHVDTCRACRQALDRAKRLASFLAETPAPPLPDRFAERVLARARELRARQTPGWSIRAWWSAFPAPMRVAAAAMLLVGTAVGMILGWGDAPVSQNTALTRAEQTSGLFAGYGLDALGDAPDGSLAESYIALLDGRNGEGR